MMEFETKTLNVKIPLSIAHLMDDRAHLNPNALSHFIATYIKSEDVEEAIFTPLQERSFNYTFKIAKEVHQELKRLSTEHYIPMNELAGRLIKHFYLV